MKLAVPIKRSMCYLIYVNDLGIYLKKYVQVIVTLAVRDICVLPLTAI